MAVAINGTGSISGVPAGGMQDGAGPVLGTAKASTSGTSIDFSPADNTGIPSWVKRVTVMFNGVSTAGTSEVILRLGTSAGIQATGYLTTSSVAASLVASVNDTTGFRVFNNGGAATDVRNGVINFVLMDLANGIWAAAGLIGQSDAARMCTIAGAKTLSGTLDRVRITTVNGTDTFDAGSINIMYE